MSARAVVPSNSAAQCRRFSLRFAELCGLPSSHARERGAAPDHPEVRDLSYERSRSRQMYDLLKDSLIDFGLPELENPHDPRTWPADGSVEVNVYEQGGQRGKECDQRQSTSGVTCHRAESEQHGRN
jgi:hypothetical protein